METNSNDYRHSLVLEIETARRAHSIASYESGAGSQEATAARADLEGLEGKLRDYDAAQARALELERERNVKESRAAKEKAIQSVISEMERLSAACHRVVASASEMASAYEDFEKSSEEIRSFSQIFGYYAVDAVSSNLATDHLLREKIKNLNIYVSESSLEDFIAEREKRVLQILKTELRKDVSNG